MGPRQRCRGRQRMCNWRVNKRQCFNGATTKVSWKARHTRSSSGADHRSFNGATTKVSWKAGATSSIRVVHANASMGPRRRCRGRRRAACRAQPDGRKLQWGHDEGVVEGTSNAVCNAVSEVSFNGATTKVSWKAVPERAQRRAASSGFNGATTKVSWKACRWATHGQPTEQRFNGATTKVSWKAT